MMVLMGIIASLSIFQIAAGIWMLMDCDKEVKKMKKDIEYIKEALTRDS